MKTWIKICGITNLEDALTAVEAGADALGFVFYEKSSRYVSLGEVQKMIRELPGRIEKVGVFVNASDSQVREIAEKTGITAMQICMDGANTKAATNAAHFEQLAAEPSGLKLIPVLSMRNDYPERPPMMWNPKTVHAFLLDSGSGGQPGGTGQRFDWAARQSAISSIKSQGRIIVAGGLTPGNVSEAMRILKPWGVDVSSGVESHPGKKDPEKVRSLISAVRAAEF